MASIGDVFLALHVDGKQFSADVTKQAGAAGDKAGSVMGSRLGKALKIGIGVGVGVAAAVAVRGLTGAISSGVASLRELGVVEAQTNAVIKSTGNAARVTTKHIRDLSEKTEDLTTIDDKTVQAGANMLLTFTNVRNEVGEGNDIFDQSVAALADMSIALGKDMPTAAVALGKALNDPVKGISALTRNGVVFDEATKKRIKLLVSQGKTLEAQKIILAELNKEFGESGAMFAATDAGKAAKFQDAIEGIQMSLARALLPAITRVQEALTKFLSDPATMAQAERLGEMIASIFSEGNLKTAASLMTGAAQAIGTAFKLFGQLPKELQALAVGALALKKFTGIGPIDIIKTIGGEFFKKGGSPANPLFVKDVAGGLGGALAGGSKGLLGKILGLLPAAAIATGIIAAAIPIGEAFADALPDWLKGPNGAGESESQRRIREGREREGAWNKGTGSVKSDLAGAPQMGGRSPDERGEANAAGRKAELAAIMERAIKAGFRPTQQAIEATFARNEKHLTGIKAAVGTAGQQTAFAIRDTTAAVNSLPLRLKNALGGILFGGRAPGKEKDDRNVGLPTKPKVTLQNLQNIRERATGGPVIAGRPYWVGETGERELYVPRLTGSLTPESNIRAVQGNREGGVPPINVTLNGLPRSMDPFEVATQLKRVRDFVTLTPRRQPA